MCFSATLVCVKKKTCFRELNRNFTKKNSFEMKCRYRIDLYLLWGYIVDCYCTKNLSQNKQRKSKNPSFRRKCHVVLLHRDKGICVLWGREGFVVRKLRSDIMLPALKNVTIITKLVGELVTDGTFEVMQW